MKIIETLKGNKKFISRIAVGVGTALALGIVAVLVTNEEDMDYVELKDNDDTEA